MKLLHVISSVDPRGGGIAEGVLRLTAALAALGHDAEVLTLDAPDTPHVKAFPAKVHAIGPSRGTYAYNAALVPWLRQNAMRFDAVIVNGLWQFPGLATLTALRDGDGQPPYYVFPHGMLDPWFKHRYPLKHLKKWLYWPWAEYRVLRSAASVLFTCEEERLLARKSFWLYRCREAVVSYGTSAPPTDAARLSERFLAAHPALRGKRIVLFLGRIHEKKGCDLLVDAFAHVARRAPDVQLVMAGPDQEGWVAELQARALALGVADRITWPGMLSGDLKWGAFYAAEVFCLPSHQENFGIAVAEALACGRPVLISDKVNIWREVEQDSAGFIETDSPEGTQRVLQRWLDATPTELTTMRAAALRCFHDRFRIERVAENVVRVIRGHAAGTSRLQAPLQDAGR
ncbi:MAG: glycosyltransferase [Comamonadaceae bacterium]|nr:MAG: glycosyltransferase [Comamonadaceae bacterium]